MPGDEQALHFLDNGPADSERVFLFAHGAGAPMDSGFQDAVARGLAERGIRVLRFEFPYMAARREDPPRKRPPDRMPVLLDTWRNAIAQAGGARPYIGGKSMGGRAASLLADEVDCAGLICLGYPFHPAGKPDRLRTEHLQTLRTRSLIVQGERDPMGSRPEMEGYGLSDRIELCWMPDGDHSFKPRKRSGHSEQGNLERAIQAVADFTAAG